jgi:hypothetical protein
MKAILEILGKILIEKIKISRVRSKAGKVLVKI